MGTCFSHVTSQGTPGENNPCFVRNCARNFDVAQFAHNDSFPKALTFNIFLVKLILLLEFVEYEFVY